MRILWYSAGFWAPTGYGKVSRNVVMRIKERYEIVYLASTFNGDVSYPLNVEGIDVFPKYDIKKQKQIREVVKLVKPDLIVSLHDVWWLTNNMDASNPELGLRYGDYWIPYTPIDAPLFEECPLLDPLKEAVKIIVMSKFGYEELKKFFDNVVYIPHGVDTKAYRPMPKDKVRALYGFPEDKFVFGFVGENYSERKDIPRLLRAYKIFHENYPDLAKDTMIYLHSDPMPMTGLAFNLHLISKKLGIEKYVYTRSGYLHEKYMPELYNCFDVYVTASRGEGFGVPIIEAQACGVPVIAPRNSAQTELVENHGWLVKCGNESETLWTPTHQSYPIVDPYDLADKMAEAVNDDEKRKKYSEEARKFALEYDWDKKVVPMWVEFIDSVGEELGLLGDSQ